ncbi:MAG: transporter substrate-binding domain-containing protein [Ruminococcus sp.]|jgi:polar amino acid transport system substrate-binding protein|nr:transporter substrate-binding domain-containing protein [Ruminococcus sp.]MBQ1535851.1 transporter substrate-binding domain-containing protein [Ruminococcus sp.]
MKKFVKILSMTVAAAIMAVTFTACADSSSSSDSKSGGSIKFGTNAEFPPFEYVVSKGVIGEFDGIDMAIAKQIGEDNNKEAKIENMEFDSLLVALDNGKIDAAIAGMTVTDERKEKVDFSEPYYNAKQVMIVKEDSNIAKASDMSDKKIVVIQGYTGETCVKKLGFSYQSFKKGTEAIMELVNGKCDVVVIDSATADKYVKDNKGLKVVEDNKEFENEEYAIAVKKGNKELLDQINKTIKKMKEDGKINELAAKYADATNS